MNYLDHESPDPETPKQSATWERELLNRLAFASLIEQRRARRWGIFFKFGLLFYLIVLVLLYAPDKWTFESSGDRHTALVDLEGVIAADSEASADKVIAGLRAAFKDENTAGVILRINSPGGSPVQSAYINDEIVRLRKKYPEISLYAVITDICASGGYYVAAAADKIYADKSSIVGSIGVLMNGFGFVDAMEKLGVERRLFTAGEHKGLLDPFSPLRSDEVNHLNTLLADMHKQFIATVKRGRGDRIKDETQLFSGLVWTGEQGLALGLVDELGSAGKIARDVIGAETIVDFSARKDYLERLVERFGASFAGALGKLALETSLR